MYDACAMLFIGLSMLLLGVSLPAPGGFQIQIPLDGLLLRKRRAYDASGNAAVVLRSALRVTTYHVKDVRTGSLDARLAQKLIRAGYPAGLVPLEMRGAAIVSGLLAQLLGQWTVLQTTGTLSWLLAPVFLALGVSVPFLWLDEAERLRSNRVNRALPYVLDLVAMSMSAGNDFNGSLQRVVARRQQGDPLTEELELLLRDIAMGRTRREALLSLNDRLRSEYIADVVLAVNQAEQMGTPLAQVLKVQARAIRLKRYHRAETIAGELPVKLLLPLCFFALAIMLTVLGPVMIEFGRSQF